ncbi:glycosyltransferase [Nonomuraea sp. NPDC050451]|uniref:glycosyltransferase n=1 Tax=Nonomuraea sp. NPDC050451 TaxID=3364364 RepID=UPI0037A9B6B6
MKIDLVSEHADPLAAIGGVDAGGQNVHVAALAFALARRGHDVVVHTRRSSPEQPRSVPLGDRVRVEYVRAGPAVPIPKDELPPYMPAFAEQLARRWTRRAPDIVHAHFWMSGKAALLAAGHRRVVQTFHALGTVKRRWQGSADTSPPGRIDAERRIGREAAAVLATCSDEVGELHAMGVPGHVISIVPCGVDLDHFTPEGPRADRGTRPRVLSVGRLVPRKGVDTVLRALREVPEAELLIAGGSADDPEAARLAGLAGAYGLADRVKVLGSVPHDEVPALMRSADVVVTVPWYEPFGMVPLEAMACGVPVIASAVGGHLDTVDGCGVLIPPRRPQALAHALRDLLEAPQRAAELGAAGARRAGQRYGWPRVAEQTEAVYRAVLGAELRGMTCTGT